LVTRSRGIHKNRTSPRDLNFRRKRHPVRLWNDDFISCIEPDHGGVEKRLLGAGGNANFIGAIGTPQRAETCSATRSRRFPVPRVGVYLLQPASTARLAAVFIRSLASPSNSPAAKLMTSTPDLFKSLASSRLAEVPGGVIVVVRSASITIPLRFEMKAVFRSRYFPCLAREFLPIVPSKESESRRQRSR
jgi:hypothetical protein